MKQTDNFRKESELVALAARLEDEQSLVVKVQRQVKEMQSRIQELEEELESERQSRQKVKLLTYCRQTCNDKLLGRKSKVRPATRARRPLGSTRGSRRCHSSTARTQQKREAETQKLRRDLEEANLQHEAHMTALRKKHNDAVAEMGEQLDSLQKQRAK